MIEFTNYKIECNFLNCKVYENNKLIAITLLGKDSALHAIWVMNGRNSNVFYEEIDGKVYIRAKDE